MQGLYDIIMAIVSNIPWITFAFIVHDICKYKPRDLEITYGEWLQVYILCYGLISSKNFAILYL